VKYEVKWGKCKCESVSICEVSVVKYECGVWSVKCEVWSVKCEYVSVKNYECEM
jgi:hypothetical protein